ncbi:hypothetical protein HJC23_005037 [Cyclotella cryptica]|uniref:Uncharacterized protein n=1 Tax=Cyclotella cryptica TaxID=29204 RepID=A0ABD3QDB2_9STRA|eukprot:CCRYP_006246-RA/>CCRYP_006246-RA protein AED:0.04 eAED:0.04 QI:95/1/1/1/1/1/2/82/383
MSKLQSRPFRFIPAHYKVVGETSTADENSEMSLSSEKTNRSRSASSSIAESSSSSLIHSNTAPKVIDDRESSIFLVEFIDNSRRIYTAHKLKCGVTIQVGEHVLEECPSVLEDLNYDLMECLLVLPASVRSLVRRTKIWLNRNYSYGPVNNPKTVRHTTAHHFAGWLLCVRDNPEKTESIEIYDAAEYQKTRAHYNGGGLMLHELCHIIHQKVLPAGLNNPMVIEIYRVASESTKYTTVLRRDWALKDVEYDMAYCIVNYKEFFAEISVTYLADFYHEVDGAGSQDMAKCSPPFVSLAVIERIQNALSQNAKSGNINARGNSKYQIIEDTNRVLPHCNKFFPFTKGQLRLYDPRVYKCFEKLWDLIENWEDKDKRRCESCVWF